QAVEARAQPPALPAVGHPSRSGRAGEVDDSHQREQLRGTDPWNTVIVCCGNEVRSDHSIRRRAADEEHGEAHEDRDDRDDERRCAGVDPHGCAPTVTLDLSLCSLSEIPSASPRRSTNHPLTTAAPRTIAAEPVPMA